MMARCAIPTPCIVPLRIPFINQSKSIDTNTRIELLCDTYIEHEIFYTLDGTKPQPYAGIVQGSKVYKYVEPFCLPAGKKTIKAIALNPRVPSMCSSVITKCFEVVNVISSTPKPKSKVQNKYPKSTEIKPTDVGDKTGVFHDVNVKEKPLQVNVEEIKFRPEDQNGISKTCDGFDVDKMYEPKSVDHECQMQVKENEDVLDVKNSFEDILETLDDMSDGSLENFSQLQNENHEINELIVSDDAKVESVQVKKTFPVHNSVTDFQPCCIKCEMCVQYCLTCNQVNAYNNKYCIQCGERLAKICYNCNQQSAITAIFCQYCGTKLDEEHSFNDPTVFKALQIDQSILVKPNKIDASIQQVPMVIDKTTQTCPSFTDKKLDQKDLKLHSKRLPTHSPGRGYWHQQLDFICNHLKTHAYNNIEFRKIISEPSLSNFQSAHVVKEENQVVVTIIFSPYVEDNN